MKSSESKTMTISELELILSFLKKTYGDVDVCVSKSDDAFVVRTVCFDDEYDCVIIDD